VRLVLASASPARLAVLRAAGVEPEVVVSGVPEDDVVGAPGDVALTLARRKAYAVADRVGRADDLVIVACDSVLDIDGTAYGKPADAAEATRRWQQMRGGAGVLRTGHWVLRGALESAAVASTTVRFGRPSDAEIDAYVATAEPLAVAGAFTIDGLGGWFIEGVDGDPGNVTGISLPLLRRLLAELDVGVTDLWP
jgi:septum formation protein